MKKIFVRTGLVAALLLGSALAQAQTVTVTGWTFGNGNVVNSTSPAGSETGQAGAFNIVTSGYSDPFAGTFSGYCVDLYQTFVGPPSSAMTGYVGVAGAADTFAAATGGFGANASAITNRLSALMTYALPLVTNASQSTSLQLAIWEVIYDNATDVTVGAFKDSSAYDNFANALLAGSANTKGTYAVNILHSDSNQDFMITPVPEPSTYALMLAGLAGIGFVARRRAQR